jgi:hypothetical protein
VRLRYAEHTWRELSELADRDDLVVVISTATLALVDGDGSNQPLVDVEHGGAVAGSRLALEPDLVPMDTAVREIPGWDRVAGPVGRRAVGRGPARGGRGGVRGVDHGAGHPAPPSWEGPP